MATVPTTPDFTSGVSSSTQFNQLSDAIDFLLSPPIAELRQTVAQTLTTGVWASVTFDVEDKDSVSGHDTVTNNSRYTAVYAGWYQCSGGVGFVVNATGIRGTRWSVNGTALNGSQTSEAPTTVTAAQWTPRTKQIYLNVGDYVELQAFQSSGGNLNTDVTTTNQSHMSVRWVSN